MMLEAFDRALRAIPAGLDRRLVDFMEDLKADPLHGPRVEIKSTIRDANQDARAVLNNMRKDRNYSDIFAETWREAINDSCKDRDLGKQADYQEAVNDLRAWIEAHGLGPHGRGTAVDLGLGNDEFKKWLITKCANANVYFKDETKFNHYHLQIR